MADGVITEKILEKGYHFIEVALNEVPLFVRKGKCIPVAAPTETVDELDEETIELIGYEGASYELYTDDGVGKDYENPEHYKMLKMEE